MSLLFLCNLQFEGDSTDPHRLYFDRRTWSDMSFLGGRGSQISEIKRTFNFFLLLLSDVS